MSEEKDASIDKTTAIKGMASQKEPEAAIVALSEFLNTELVIPEYQRAYEWGRSETLSLLENMRDAYVKRISHARDEDWRKFKYRLGTVILYDDGKGKTEIVDGQQRYVTLRLLAKSVGADIEANKETDGQAEDASAAENLSANSATIKKWLSAQEKFTTFLKGELGGKNKQDENESEDSKLFEVVVVRIFDLSMAFQLFETQTTRGKRLCPHDELKAYHLANDAFESGDKNIETLIENWDSRDGSLKTMDGKERSLAELFCEMLFKIVMWRRGERASFAQYVIENYAPEKKQFYGVTKNDPSPFAERARAAGDNFQIGASFERGEKFFKFVEHYGEIYDELTKWIEKNEIYEGLEGGKNKYTRLLFETALMLFVDKFAGKQNVNELDGEYKRAVKVIFCWAFALREYVESLYRKTADNYARGDSEGRKYVNGVAMLKFIANATSADEIARIEIVKDDGNVETVDKNKIYIREETLKKANKLFGE